MSPLSPLQVILLPWSYWLIKAILFPRPSAELDFESGGSAPDGSQVRLCKTSFMEVSCEGDIGMGRIGSLEKMMVLSYSEFYIISRFFLLISILLWR